MMAYRKRTTRVLLLGKTGAGKSSFGNFILGRSHFSTETGFGSVTGDPAKGEVDLDGETFCVIDTPGLCDASDVMNDEEGLKLIAKGIQLAAGDDGCGVDAVLLVLNAGSRFTRDEQRMMEYFESEKGEFWSHVTLVLTNAKKLGTTPKEQRSKFQQLLASSRTSTHYKQMVQNVGDRYVFVESVDYSTSYRQERLTKVRQNIKCVIESTGKRYTTELFEEVQACGSDEKRAVKVLRKEVQSIPKSNDCFPENAIVFTQTDGPKEMKFLRPGEKVLTLTTKGHKIFTEVITFLHYLPDDNGAYISLRSENGTTLAVSASHLIYTTNGKRGSCNESKRGQLGMKATYAGSLRPGDKIISVSQGILEMESIKSMRYISSHGVYCPITRSGTIVVNGVLSSCYAQFPNQCIAHAALAPLRIQSRFAKAHISKGMHPYARFLRSAVQQFAPKYLEHQQARKTAFGL